MRQWRWIGHALIKSDESIEMQTLNWNRREPDGEEDRSKPAKWPFMEEATKQEYAAQYGERLRGCRATEADGDAPQIC
jgi:hypothetical protein